MIVRIKRRENPFVQIDKTCLEDSRLTWQSKGLLAYLLSKPDNWVVTYADILRRGTGGVKVVRSAFRALSKNGYATLINTVHGREWLIREQPVHQPSTQKGKMLKGTHDRDNDKGAPKFAYPTNERQMHRILEQQGIEPNPDYDGEFFTQMRRSDWRIKGEPVFDWIATYQARVAHITEPP